MDCAALPKGRFVWLWTSSQMESSSLTTLSCDICDNLKSHQPLSQCVTVFLYIYIVLHTYICCELTKSSCILLCKRNSHECLQEQEEAPWNRKESNVWERGGYLLPFDLLWSELECVLGCRADLQSLGSHRPCYGIFGYLSPRCKSLKTLLNRLRLWACSGNTVGSPRWALLDALRVKKNKSIFACLQ